MSVTIKDIAKLADVSTATVSNVLTQKKFVSQELEHRVYATIDQLGYRPNVYARGLKTNRSYTIGVQVPDITNPFFSSSVKTIQCEANANGYQIMLYDSDSSIGTETQNINNMNDAHVDICWAEGMNALSVWQDLPVWSATPRHVWTVFWKRWHIMASVKSNVTFSMAILPFNPAMT